MNPGTTTRAKIAGKKEALPGRRYPVGAEVTAEGVHFRVWAPKADQVTLEHAEKESFLKPAEAELHPEAGGYFSGMVPDARAGTFYRFRLPTGAFPDPASRFQPAGPHGPSQVVDPTRFKWDDADWKGPDRQGQVIYELHIGTFTPEGTWEAALSKLPKLAEVGITMVELLPVADFSGRFGWGYDGVNLYAPTRLYGTPDDFRAFVNEAHSHGLSVILDVVYNHMGPDGNYLGRFSDDYETDRHKNEWGKALNFDGRNSACTREFFSTNAAYWIDEFHLDGLRLDAMQQIFDDSPEHILKVIGMRAREAAGNRKVFIVGENECQTVTSLLPTEKGGYGLEAQWNDDWHHAALAALTGRREAYYTDYRGTPQEFISAARHGYLYQGQWYRWQKKPRGQPTVAIAPEQFVAYTENHDQIANSLRGRRLHQLTGPSEYRAINALLLLGPATPMLFQGQEFQSSAPFLYFADHNPELAELVKKGRKEFLHQFSSIASPEAETCLHDPSKEESFAMCKLDWREWERNGSAVEFCRDLIQLRRTDPVFSNPERGGVDGAVLGPEAFCLRFKGRNGDDRLMLVNLGVDLPLSPLPEPLMAPPVGGAWRVIWSSEDPRYGGCGIGPMETDDSCFVPGKCALVLAAACFH